MATSSTETMMGRKKVMFVVHPSLIYVDHVHRKGGEKTMTMMLLHLMHGGCMHDDADDCMLATTQWDDPSWHKGKREVAVRWHGRMSNTTIKKSWGKEGA